MSASETVETLDVANPITPDLVHDAEQSRELARAIDDRLAAAHERWGQGRELTLVQLTSETLYWLQMASTALAEVARRVAYAYDVLPKVGWEQWLANDLKLGKRTGYNLLKIAHRLLADGQDHERVLRLGPSKVYELLANFDDEQIETLEQGGTVEDLDLDRFDDMSVREMKRSLRKLKEKSTTYLKRAQEAESAFEGQRKELREVVYGKVATDQVPTTIQQRWRHTELDLAALYGLFANDLDLGECEPLIYSRASATVEGLRRWLGEFESLLAAASIRRTKALPTSVEINNRKVKLSENALHFCGAVWVCMTGVREGDQIDVSDVWSHGWTPESRDQAVEELVAAGGLLPLENSFYRWNVRDPFNTETDAVRRYFKEQGQRTSRDRAKEEARKAFAELKQKAAESPGYMAEFPESLPGLHGDDDDDTTSAPQPPHLQVVSEEE